MNKFKYLKLRKFFSLFIKARENQIKDIEKEYIDSNSEYKPGDEVELYRWGEYRGDGIVTGNEIDKKDPEIINPIINRVDENGKPINTRWWSFFNYDKIKRK